MKNETTKHTPAPWHVTLTGHIASQKGNIVAFTGGEVANSMGGKSLLHPDERSANAKLIARAPELLKENEQLKRKYNQDVTAYIKAGAKAEASKVELLDRLKMSNMAFKSLLEEEQGTVGSGEYFQKMKENRIRIFMDMLRNNNAAIAKAEGKTLVV